MASPRLALALVVLAGCAQSTAPADAGTSDAPASDAPASDAGPLGRDCSADPSVCTDGTFCYFEVCTRGCGTIECPDGWTCLYGACAPRCDPGGVIAECPEGS